MSTEHFPASNCLRLAWKVLLKVLRCAGRTTVGVAWRARETVSRENVTVMRIVTVLQASTVVGTTVPGHLG